MAAPPTIPAPKFVAKVAAFKAEPTENLHVAAITHTTLRAPCVVVSTTCRVERTEDRLVVVIFPMILKCILVVGVDCKGEVPTAKTTV